MAKKLPPCPACSGPLEAIRSDTRGLIWAQCQACEELVLVDADGRIQRTVEREP